MKAIITRVLNTNVKKVVIYLIISTIFLVLYAGLFPELQSQGEDFQKLLSSFPEGFLDAFGFKEGLDFFSNFGAFLSTEYFSFVWPIMAITFLISYGSGAIAGEIERGTIDIILSQPISRLKVYFGKVFAGIDLLTIFIIITISMIWPIARVFNVDISIQKLIITSIGGALFCFSILGLSFFFSSFTSTSGRATLIVAFILLVMYALDLLANLNADYDFVQYFSYFYYFDQNALLIEGKLAIESILVLGVTGTINILFGAFLFLKRDISV